MDEYERRDRVEEALLAALRAGELEAVLDRSFVIPARFWRGEEEGFRCRLELSLAAVPSSFSSRRLNPVLVPIRAFEEWLRTVPPIWREGGFQPSPAEACAALLREAINSGGRKPKAEHRRLARERIPGLSGRQFNAVWDRLAPPSWKRPGRPAAKS